MILYLWEQQEPKKKYQRDLVCNDRSGWNGSEKRETYPFICAQQCSLELLCSFARGVGERDAIM